MRCFPKCDVSLPHIGNTKVLTSFDTCRTPTELTITIKHEVRSTSTFVSRDATIDSRNIGTAPWPLKLNVQFLQDQPNEYFVKACVVTERHNEASCFMNSTYTAQEIGSCGEFRKGTSPVPMFLISSLLAVFLLILLLGAIFLLYKLFMHFCSHPQRQKSYHKQSQCTALIAPVEHQKYDFEDDRLTVIEEEKEETSHMSPSSSESALDNGEQKASARFLSNFRSSPTTNTIVSAKRTLFTFKPPMEEV